MNKLLNYGRTDKNKPQKQGFTPLHAAIHKDLDDTAKRLALDVDVNVNAKDVYGKTALHVACEKAKVGLIQTLLAKGADPRIITKRGDTVYHILRKSKKYLSENKSNNSQCAEQVMSEFDPEIDAMLSLLGKKIGVGNGPRGRKIQIHTTIDSHEDKNYDYLEACASIQDKYDKPKRIKKKQKRSKNDMYDDYDDVDDFKKDIIYDRKRNKQKQKDIKRHK
jgi:hypothetical protein